METYLIKKDVSDGSVSHKERFRLLKRWEKDIKVQMEGLDSNGAHVTLLCSKLLARCSAAVTYEKISSETPTTDKEILKLIDKLDETQFNDSRPTIKMPRFSAPRRDGAPGNFQS
ncbi:hypothetical protein SK128_026916 [Halocaridina rubra]|uniref:Uncharacterized protein n=1 Tax=Halocaridina rubra TaxID=373956 RepID=A0AAN8WMH9_HALRR